MDIRYLIVGAPFIGVFFYSLFWLKKWGAFNSSIDNHTKNDSLQDNLIIEKIFLSKN